MVKTISDEQKQQVLELHDQDYSYRQIAREIGISHATVGTIIRQSGRPTNAAATAEATRARMARLNAKRLAHAEMLTEQIDDMAHRIWDEYEIYMNGPQGAERVVMAEPPLKEQADGYKGMQAMVNMIDTLQAALDTGDDTEHAKSLLTQLQQGFEQVVAIAGDDNDPLNYDSDYSIHTDPEQQVD